MWYVIEMYVHVCVCVRVCVRVCVCVRESVCVIITWNVPTIRMNVSWYRNVDKLYAPGSCSAPFETLRNDRCEGGGRC